MPTLQGKHTVAAGINAPGPNNIYNSYSSKVKNLILFPTPVFHCMSLENVV